MSDAEDRGPRHEAHGTLRERLRRSRAFLADRLSTPAGVLGLSLFAFLAGLHTATYSGSVDARHDSLRSELRHEQQQVRQLEGRLAALRVESDRLRDIHRYSSAHSIPSGLAALIHDTALQEGVDPAVAFRLVSVESSFRARAVSAKGAVGYTQIKPSTARWLDPSVSAEELFEPRTNLRLGFQYLRRLMDQFDGDQRLALLAYNQGPGRVDAQLTLGRDPGNGYARSVLATGQ